MYLRVVEVLQLCIMVVKADSGYNFVLNVLEKIVLDRFGKKLNG